MENGIPSNNGFVHRGVTYWAEAKDRRILFGTGDGYLVCLNAATGKPIPTLGHEGRIDLTQGLGRSVDRHLYGVSSPPVICRDVVVMGSKVNDIPLAAKDATRRRARIRRAHRQAAVDFPFHSKTGRVRERDLEEGFLANDGRGQRLDDDERGRSIGLRLPAV
jgi:hypothetical protein